MFIIMNFILLKYKEQKKKRAQRDKEMPCSYSMTQIGLTIVPNVFVIKTIWPI
jgi:hypothetical protein